MPKPLTKKQPKKEVRPEWLHCVHWTTGMTFSVQAIWFTFGPLPAAVCEDCRNKVKLTPLGVCAGTGPHPFSELQVEDYEEMIRHDPRGETVN